MIALFSFFTATCFTVTVFAVPFYALGASADAAFRISALWLLTSIPFGCAVGAHLRRRDNFAARMYARSVEEKI